MKIVFESSDSNFKVYEDGTIAAKNATITAHSEIEILRQALKEHADKIRILERQIVSLRRDLDYDVIYEYVMDGWGEMLDSWNRKADDDTP